jgi:hypothetical protein
VNLTLFELVLGKIVKQKLIQKKPSYGGLYKF